MKRGILLLVGLGIVLAAGVSHGEWKMRVHRGGQVDVYTCSQVESLTFFDDLIPPTVIVPAGVFTMGDGAASCGVDERLVTLTRAFRLGQHEVTNGEYIEALQWAYDHGYVTATEDSVQDAMDGSTETLLRMANDFCEIQFGGGLFTLRESPTAIAQVAYPDGYDPGRHPVKMVTWYGCARFCDWLSLNAGLPRAYQHQGDWSCNGGDPYGAYGFRLPTNAEWEYAAQFDNERIYPWGNEAPDCGRANYTEDSVTVCVGWTTAVGKYPDAPVVLGLSDMAGNVAEMCNDLFQCNLGTAPETDPVGPSVGAGRVLLGGCSFWITCCASYGEHMLKCAARGIVFDDKGEIYGGFRIARTVSP